MYSYNNSNGHSGNFHREFEKYKDENMKMQSQVPIVNQQQRLYHKDIHAKQSADSGGKRSDDFN